MKAKSSELDARCNPGMPRTGFDDKALMILTNKAAIASVERSLKFVKVGILG